MDDASDHVRVALAQLHAGRHDLAVKACLGAIERNPADARVRRILATALEAMGRLEEAACEYQQALRIEPDRSDTHNDLALIWCAMGRLDEAVASLTRAIQLNPDHVQAYSNLSLVLRDLGRSDEAVASCSRALRVKPDNAIVHNNLGLALEDEGLLDQAVESYRKAIQLDPGNAAIHSNLLLALNYSPTTGPAKLFQEHLCWARAHATIAAPPQPHTNEPDPDRRLRLAYVSPDFRSHPAVYFLEPLLANHDRLRFEIVGYGNVRNPDQVTTRLRSRCDAFVNVWPMTDQQLAQKVRDDRIDILVDLAGHTANNRLTMFAHKPAPVQIAYLGYQNTTGLEAMDYRITDDVTDPPEDDENDRSPFCTERLLRLKCGFLCFNPSPDAPDVSPLPAQRNGHITFLASHRLVKVNDRVLDLWCGVLKATPTSRLILAPRSVSPASMQRITRKLIDRGLDQARFEFQHRHVTGRQYLSVFDEVDLMLDALPTSAGTTACEALWMGVPLITLQGDRYAGRMAASILTRVGFEQFIARTPEQYIDLAVRWSSRPADLGELRAGMRQRLRQSTLCDTAGFVAELEAAYHSAWCGWCSR